jgi:hypothetical protein
MRTASQPERLREAGSNPTERLREVGNNQIRIGMITYV